MNAGPPQFPQHARARGLRATYRLQLSGTFTFSDAAHIVPYLVRLGVSHLYLSPVFQARAGSTHGYDMTRPDEVSVDLGGEAGFRALADAAHAHGMGIVVDVVPNHMAVMTAENPHWVDVLENGAAAESARIFDIDWHPNRRSMHGRLLVPMLAGPFGDILEQGCIRVAFDAGSGSLHFQYESQRLPLDPATYPELLDAASQKGLADHSLDPLTGDDLENLSADFARLPRGSLPDEVRQRYRDKEAGKRRLQRLCERNPAVEQCIGAAIEEMNGTPGNPSSFDRLAGLLDRQPYRLAYWRVAGEEINYRRFFDVDGLAAVRMEEDFVFDVIHGGLKRLLADGLIDGLRIDHADGLRDPPSYLSRLAGIAPGPRPYIVVEKILGTGESLPEDWPVDGTTGYEFAAAAGSWLLHPRGMPILDRAWRSFTGNRFSFDDIEYESKRHIMRTSLAAEITLLAIRLDRLAQSHRRHVDLTFLSLRDAVVEILAAFPVYRTYGEKGMTADEERTIARAIGSALGRGRADREALAFLKAVLLREDSVTAGNSVPVADFIARFQQVSAPVMAKSVEDTAFYRFPRLMALNEVGGNPRVTGISTAQLHAFHRKRAAAWPLSLLATATHDSKLGEDVRCRLYVLSEKAPEWQQLAGRWLKFRARPNSPGTAMRTLEYLLLQALTGTFPAAEPADRDVRSRYRERLAEYALKAAREAKQFTSWLQPDAEQEAALDPLIERMLPENGTTGFETYFAGLLQPVAAFGMLNSLSLLVLKLTAPGVPDIYQGTELPQFAFVDPDNRRAVDYSQRADLLDRLEGAVRAHDPKTSAMRLLQEWWSGEIKTFVLWRLLAERQRSPAVFAGRYIPLKVVGPHANHLCAYLRRTGVPADGACIVVVSRWLATLSGGQFPLPSGAVMWVNTTIEVPASVPRGRYVDALTGTAFEIGPDCSSLSLGSVLATLPIAVLALAGTEASP